MFPVALQFYSVRDFSEKDFFGTLKKIKDMGYDGVEFAGLMGKAPAEVRDFCRDIGLMPVSAHVSLNEMRERGEAVFADYAEIGCRYVAVPYLMPEDRPGAPGFEKMLADIKKLAGLAKKHGIILCYHNHDFEFAKENGEYALDRIYREIPATDLQTQLDLCWVNVGGEEPVAFLRKYTGRAPTVHVKDFVMKDRKRKEGLYELIGIKPSGVKPDEGNFALRPVGQGVQDVPALLEAAKDAGTKWIIVEQDEPSGGFNSLECAKQSIDYIKAINK